MHADAGDRIEVTNNTLGAPPRHGEVLARSGSTGLRVRWDNGRESVFVPSSNCRVVEPGEARNDPVRLACHIERRRRRGRGTMTSAGRPRRS